MNHGRTVFAQLLDVAPFKHFEYLVEKSSANVRYAASRLGATFCAWPTRN